MKTSTKRLLLLAHCHFKAKRKRRRREKSFRQRLSLEGRRRRNRGLQRESLVDPELSPWQKCHDSKDDSALITVTGMDHAAFQEPLKLCFPSFDNCTPWTGDCDGTTHRALRRPNSSVGRGRSRIITAEASLGLVLAWHRFRGAEFTLQGWFGFTGSHNNV